MRRMGIGLQLFTLRDDIAADFPGTLRQVAEQGYEGVEFAGYGGLSANELNSLLQELKLKAIGSHVSWQSLHENLQGEIDYLKTIGGQYLICPYIEEDDRTTADDWKRIFAFFEEVGAEVKKQGLTFAYHNHAFEFELEIDGDFVFDAMYSQTSPESVQVEMDVCWVKFAGQDPLAYIAKYAGRLPLLHLKDFSKDKDLIEVFNATLAQHFGHNKFNIQMAQVELGQGEVPLKDIIASASAAGVDWLIVEQDVCQIPPLQSVAISMNWVNQNYLQLV